MNKQGFYSGQPISHQFYPYPAPTYPQQPMPMYQPDAYRQQDQPPNQQGLTENTQTMLPIEQSYIENIVRMNRGKHVTIYMTFSNNAKSFKGIIEAAGRDHIIISDPDSGKRYLLLMVYVDYLVFDEEIEYQYPFGTTNELTTSPPR